MGCTWEPKEHFVWVDAEEKLKEYIHSKEVEAEKAENRREDILAGKLIVTGKPAEESALVEPLYTVLAQKTEGALSRTRQNASDVGSHFNGGPSSKERFYRDISTTHASQRSTCNLCNMHVSAASTTNLRTRLQSAHKVLVIKELKADETLEVGQHSTLQTL